MMNDLLLDYGYILRTNMLAPSRNYPFYVVAFRGMMIESLKRDCSHKCFGGFLCRYSNK